MANPLLASDPSGHFNTHLTNFANILSSPDVASQVFQSVGGLGDVYSLVSSAIGYDVIAGRPLSEDERVLYFAAGLLPVVTPAMARGLRGLDSLAPRTVDALHSGSAGARGSRYADDLTNLDLAARGDIGANHVISSTARHVDTSQRITFGGGRASARQRILLASLPQSGAATVVPKRTVGLGDLAAMTAVTGDEFAMFSRGARRMIVRGNFNSVPIGPERAAELAFTRMALFGTHASRRAIYRLDVVAGRPGRPRRLRS